MLLSPAKVEIRETARHYESLRPGIADQILFKLLSKFDQIREFPEGYQLAEFPFRRVELVTVPYQFFYAVVEDMAVILGFVPACLHPLRKRRLLNDRLVTWQSA
jgi:plasmid stabilization system protein ParE